MSDEHDQSYLPRLPILRRARDSGYDSRLS